MPFMWCISLCLVVLLWHQVPSLAASAPVAPAVSPEQAAVQASSRGAFEEAVEHWREAVRVAAQRGQPGAHSGALLQLAQAYQALGQYRQALQSLTMALAVLGPQGDAAPRAAVLGSLAQVTLLLGQTKEASQHTTEALRLAQASGQTALTATLLNNLGNLQSTQHNDAEALGAFRDSARLAEQAGARLVASQAQTNIARVALRQGQHAEARAALEAAWRQLQGVEATHEKAYGLISLGLALHELRLQLPEAHAPLLLQAAAAFQVAAQVAQALGDTRAMSYAWGYLGMLYEAEQRHAEALQLTRQAVLAAQQVQAPESLYRWQWQTGRLLTALGQRDDAIAAYRRAVETLQAIRGEIGRGVGQDYTSFREVVSPVYFGLVDLLLQRAGTFTDQAQAAPYLREAREAVELLKAAELQDYFRDECVDAARTRSTSLETVSQTAVIVYPILLSDRLELLLSLPQGLRRVAVPVSTARLTQEVRALRYFLEKRTTREYLPHAQQLYTWLIRPIETELAGAHVDTLVFVPDGPLRTIPMAALHDGERFLISKYAVAITPGLNLTDPRPLPGAHAKVLALGLSQPVQGFSALPNVPGEIKAIHDLYGGEALLDQTFLLARTAETLQDHPFNIVHVASHGQFRSDVKQTFLLTFDGKLTLDRLDEIIGLFRYRDEPLELLTLSACQTAAGDDRAALGLAGVAVKAGARSALATLWYINDQASSELIAEFYRQLQQPATSRAAALQRAQLATLAHPRYEHPSYWAPFLLINNWL